MRDKGLVLRTDPFEVLLEAVGGGTALASPGCEAAEGGSLQE